jgi:hypothetical protein
MPVFCLELEFSLSNLVQVLPASVRTSDPDYGGVVAMLGTGFRLVVAMDCKSYRLQALADTPDGLVWVPAGGGGRSSSLEKIVARFGGSVAGLVDLASSLPADPAAAVPEFYAARLVQDAAFAATDWAADDYQRVVASDANIRLIVEPSGTAYRLQWIKTGDYLGGVRCRWTSIAVAASLSEIGAYLRSAAYSYEVNKRNVSDVSERVDAFLCGLPEKASHGSWRDLPPRP